MLISRKHKLPITRNWTDYWRRKQEQDGLKENPNNVIWNLTSRILSNEECLNHGIATNLKESDTLASAESDWDKISRNNICKESHYTLKEQRTLFEL